MSAIPSGNISVRAVVQKIHFAHTLSEKAIVQRFLPVSPIYLARA
jgi:hypothetical protein